MEWLYALGGFVSGVLARFLGALTYDAYTSARRRFEVKVQPRVHDGGAAEAGGAYLVIEVWARSGDLTLDVLFLEWDTVQERRSQALKDLTYTDEADRPRSLELPHDVEADTRVRLTASFPEPLTSDDPTRLENCVWVVAKDERRDVDGKSNPVWV